MTVDQQEKKEEVTVQPLQIVETGKPFRNFTQRETGNLLKLDDAADTILDKRVNHLLRAVISSMLADLKELDDPNYEKRRAEFLEITNHAALAKETSSEDGEAYFIIDPSTKDRLLARPDNMPEVREALRKFNVEDENPRLWLLESDLEVDLRKHGLYPRDGTGMPDALLNYKIKRAAGREETEKSEALPLSSSDSNRELRKI